jgi:hypothetical protein
MNTKANGKVIGLIAGAAMLAMAAPASSAVKSVDELLKAVDSNGDGMVQRSEYVAWCAHKGAMDFDKWAGGAAVMSAQDAYQNYQALLANVGG